MADVINITECKKFIFEQYVGKLLRFLRGEVGRVATNKEYMDVYRVIVYQCDELDNNEVVNQICEEFISEYLQSEVSPKILKEQQGAQLLTNLVKVWDNYCIFSKTIDRIFEYLNRFFLKNAQMPQIGEKCLDMFRMTIFGEAKGAITRAILDQIKLQRSGQAINRENIKKCIQVYVDMGAVKPKPMRTKDGVFLWQGDRSLTVYDDEFEIPYLQETKKESEQCSLRWNLECNCPEYLTNVQQALDNEETNADYWLQPETKSKMLKIVESEMITKMAEQVAGKDTGCVHMFKQKNLDELKLLFNVFRRDPTTFGLIISQMNPYVIQRGLKIVQDEENVKDPHSFTQKLLDFKAEIDELVQYSFSNQMMFQKARDNSFQEFMNQQQFTPNYIAQYADKEFRVGLKGLADDIVDQRLNAIIRIFCCLHGRDEFLKQYNKELASRLLNKTSISWDYEEKMIQKLKVECGANQVQKMTQMFKDITLSKEMQADFGTHTNNSNSKIGGVDFVAEVLTNGTWPQMDTPPCQLSPELQVCAEKFERFFKQKQANRTLTWLFAYGSVELAMTYTTKKYQLITNVFQASILCLFNENSELTCAQIVEKTGVNPENFRGAMMRFCDPKIKVLLKEINKPVFKDDEKIKVNPKFASNSIRLSLIPQKVVKKKTIEATAEENAQFKQVAKERQYVVQAHIVKVMKAQKTYSFQLVVNDVIRNITMFKADPKVVKEQIEVLIQGEYMKRDEKDRTKLIYLP